MDKNFLAFYFFFSFNNTWVYIEHHTQDWHTILFGAVRRGRLWTRKSQIFFTFHAVSIPHAVCQIVNLNFFFLFCHELTSCDIVLKGLNIFNLLLTHDFVLKQYDMF